MSLINRLETYERISKELKNMSDKMLSDLLHQAAPMHSGIGGTSATLTLEGTKVFVKKIALTDLERKSEHFLSTANLFDLPLFYQYGVGSKGFGAWRELATHLMTSKWVILENCPNFPILYHWRILPTQPKI